MIREITPKETYLIRNEVLRQGKPIESCYFDGDDLETTIHFGFFEDKNCVAIVSVFQNKNDNFDEDLQFQIRGMAVLESYKNKGLGRKLICHCEQYLEKEKCFTIWLNARESAVSFYSKMEFTKLENAFEIATIGLHFCMFKKIEVVANE